MPEKESAQRPQQQAEAEEAVVEEVALEAALLAGRTHLLRRSWMRAPKILRPVVLVLGADQREEEEGRQRWKPLQLLSPRTMLPLVAAEAEEAAAAVVGPSSLAALAAASVPSPLDECFYDEWCPARGVVVVVNVRGTRGDHLVLMSSLLASVFCSCSTRITIGAVSCCR